MGLAVGDRLGAYEILSPLGAGGMGEVYRARDTRLGRDVAVKVLPAETVSSESARRRLEREARLVSQLSHPHVCALFDVGREGTVDFLVMELAEGTTLQDRLRRGPLPLADVLRVGAQIAGALAAAHLKGVVHRDLKPGNVMLTRSGIKLLDFGIARIAEQPESPFDPDTITTPMTAAGAVIGSPPYMSPEQLEGKPADARSDIFALGCVLYEMITGRRVRSASTAAVATGTLLGGASGLDAVRPDCPPTLAWIVGNCLADDPDARWQSAHDIELHLEALAAQPAEAPAFAMRGRQLLPWLVAGLALAVAAGTLIVARGDDGKLSRTVRYQVPPPEGGTFAGWSEAVTFSVSPDGSSLVFVGYDAGGRRLFLRPLSSLESRPIPGTEGARSAFWSPDGRSLGFFAEGRLNRVDLGSGARVTLCSVRRGIGLIGTWGDGRILFASIEGDAIFSVPPAGGEPVPLLARDAQTSTRRMGWPSYLPDGRRFLYLVKDGEETPRIMLGDPDGRARFVRSADSFASYMDPGYLVFADDGTLLAQRFDPGAATVAGEPVAIAQSVDSFATTGYAAFAASRSGVLAYATGQDRARLGWFDRSGSEEPLEVTATPLWIRIAADGKRAYFNRKEPRTGNQDIWSIDLERGVESRLTSDPGTEAFALPLPDGGLVFSKTWGGAPRLFRMDTESGERKELVPAGGFQAAQDVTPDGRTLVYSERVGLGAWDFFRVSAAGGAPTPLLTTPFDESDLRVSPDGGYAAFVSNEAGQYEVYVAPFPRLAERTRVTQGGAWDPRWSPDGRELFYLTGDRELVSLPVRPGSQLELGAPRVLFTTQGKYAWSSYDVAPDGRFLAIVPESLAAEQPLTVVVDWLPGRWPPVTH